MDNKDPSTWLSRFFEAVAPTAVATGLTVALGVGISTWHTADNNAALYLQLRKNVESTSRDLQATQAVLRETITKLAIVDSWKNSAFFNGDRYTLSMGRKTEADLAALRNIVTAHNIESQKWKTIIERNTAIILDNQTDSHKHTGEQ